MSDLLRAPAEMKYADELDWLESIDENPKPFSWRLKTMPANWMRLCEPWATQAYLHSRSLLRLG